MFNLEGTLLSCKCLRWIKFSIKHMSCSCHVSVSFSFCYPFQYWYHWSGEMWEKLNVFKLRVKYMFFITNDLSSSIQGKILYIPILQEQYIKSNFSYEIYILFLYFSTMPLFMSLSKQGMWSLNYVEKAWLSFISENGNH